MMLLLCALMAGSGSAWAEDEVAVTLDFTSNTDWKLPTTKVADGTENSYTNDDGYTIKLGGGTSGAGYGYNSSGYLIMGKSGCYMTLPAFSFAVTKIVVTGRSGASGSVKQNIFVGETSVSTETTGATGTNTYKINSSYQAAGNIYTLKVTSAHNTQITQIDIYKEASTNPAIVASDVNIADDATSGAITYSINNAVDGASLTAAKKSGDWISGVTVDAENSKVTFTATVNESSEAREGVITLTYGSNLATKDVTITQAAATVKYTVTIETPENGTLVVKNGDDVVSSGDKFAEGTVLTVTATPARGYSFRNWQAVDASTHTYTAATTYTMTASAVTLKANFDEIEKYTVTLGDDNSTLTEEYGGEGVTLPSRSDVAHYTFMGWSVTNMTTGTTTAPTIIEAGTYLPTENVTLYPVYSYSAEGLATAYQLVSSLTNVTEGTYVWVSQKTTTTGQPVVYMPNDESASALPELKEGITTETTDGVTYLSNAITSDMLWDFTSTGTANQYYIRPHGDKTIGFGCTTSTGANIRIGSDYKDMKWTVSESTGHNWDFKNDATSAMYLAVYDAKKWRNYSNNTTNQNGKFYLYKAVEVEGIATYYTSNPVTSVEVTITSAEYATYCGAIALDFSSTGITAYTATDGKTKVTLNEITSGKVPANTPVVLYKADADGTAINVPVTASADAVEGTNDLHVSTGTDVDYMYVLSKQNEKVGFYPWGGTNLSAGKIYLQGKASYGARSFIGFDDVTAVGSMKALPAIEGAYYNLNGQQVTQPAKGLYIVNGKKVIFK